MGGSRSAFSTNCLDQTLQRSGNRAILAIASLVGALGFDFAKRLAPNSLSWDTVNCGASLVSWVLGGVRGASNTAYEQRPRARRRR
jgi:hypothetical protein